MADFISGVIGQLGRPMVKADQFNGIADALGRGIESVGKRQQLEGQKNEAENKKRGLLALSSVLKSANNPEQAQGILNQALSNGYLDEDDIEGMMMPDGSGLNFQLIGDVLKMESKGLLDGGISKELPSSVRETLWFNQQAPEVQQAHLKLKRGLQLTPQEKLEYERSLAGIKADQKGKEVEAVTSAENKSSDMAVENEAAMSQGKKLGELRGTILADETQNFRNSRSQTLQLKQLESALDAASTGKYSQLKTFAGKYMPGVNVDNEQALQSIVTQYALTELQKQTGPKTDFDFIKAAETQIQAGNTKGANKIILERMKENAKYAESRYEAFKKFKAKNKNFEDFEDSFSYTSGDATEKKNRLQELRDKQGL